MYENRISLERWLLLAGIALLSQYGGIGYMAMVLAVVGILPLNYLFRDGFSSMGKGISLLEWIWMGITLGTLLPAAGACWPGKQADVVVPMVMLAISAWNKDWISAGRSNGVIFWLAVPLALLVAVVGMGDLQPQWLVPERGTWSAGLLVALLLPTAISTIAPIRKGKTGLLLKYGLLAICISLLLQGVLESNIAGKSPAPLYELGRSIGRGGMELITAVLLTFGWYGFSSMMMESGARFGEKCGIAYGIAAKTTAVLAGLLIVLRFQIGEVFLTVGCLVLWILVPMFHTKNNFKKDEKSS